MEEEAKHQEPGYIAPRPQVFDQMLGGEEDDEMMPQ